MRLVFDERLFEKRRLVPPGLDLRRAGSYFRSTMRASP
jgi:hypothetical protein